MADYDWELNAEDRIKKLKVQRAMAIYDDLKDSTVDQQIKYLIALIVNLEFK